jgi:Na+/phosphate symporter
MFNTILLYFVNGNFIVIGVILLLYLWRSFSEWRTALSTKNDHQIAISKSTLNNYLLGLAGLALIAMLSNFVISTL